MESNVEKRLQRNVMENISLLKMMEAYGDRISCQMLERDREWGLLLKLPTACSAFDQAAYPGTDSVVFVSGSDMSLIAELLDRLPGHTPFVFKIQKQEYRELIEAKYPVKRMRAFYSYTCDRPLDAASGEEVTEEDCMNERLLPLWTSNGYGVQEISGLFDEGARSYAIYRNGSPVSTCLTFCNYGNVWEVGAVFTAPEHRGHGYARIVVSRAIHQLLSRNAVPRYQTVHDNAASIRVAEALGLKRVVVLEHLLYDGR